MIELAFSVWIGFVIGDFLLEGFKKDRNWIRPIHSSIDQGVAIAVFAWVLSSQK